jgi:hypothetical protein
MATKLTSPARRGVLLLIVLGMLAMFALIGLMFVLTSNQQLRGAKSAQRVDETADPPAKLARDCIAQILRGTQTRTTIGLADTTSSSAFNLARTTDRTDIAFGGSVMAGPHSLLETLYGTKARLGQIPTLSRFQDIFGGNNNATLKNAKYVVSAPVRSSPATPPAPQVAESAGDAFEGQLIAIPIVPVADKATTSNNILPGVFPVRPFDPEVRVEPKSNNVYDPLADTKGPCDNPNVDQNLNNNFNGKNLYYRRFVGCVLTMTNGPAAGISTRIVDFIPAATIGGEIYPPYFHVLAMPGMSVKEINKFLNNRPNGTTKDETRPSITYIVNGAPFSGVGVGYNYVAEVTPWTASDVGAKQLEAPLSATVALDKLTPDWWNGGTSNAVPWLALLPNHPVHRQFRKFQVPATGSGDDSLSGYSYLDVDPGQRFVDNNNPGHPGNVPGGANVDYTAVDYQHMLLAMMLPRTQHNPDGTVKRTVNGGVTVPIPSLHRAELFHYWAARVLDPKFYSDYSQKASSGKGNGLLASADNMLREMVRTNPELAYSISMRPIGQVPFHPRFTGSGARSTIEKVPNPTDPSSSGSMTSALRFNPFWDGKYVQDPDTTLADTATSTCQWDVDNDGDGVPDSVWVDFGLPVRRAANGKLYKPLVAVLCVDMDGRLNVNAQGCIAHTNTVENPILDGSKNPFYPQINQSLRDLVTGAYYKNTNAQVYAGLNISDGKFQPAYDVKPSRGQGVGPADISLRPILPFNLNAQGTYDFSDDPYIRLLQGAPAGSEYLKDKTLAILGRYGDKPGYGIPGRARSDVNPLMPYYYGTSYAAPAASSMSAGSPLYWNRFPEYYRDYWNAQGTSTSLHSRLVRTDAYGTPPDLFANSGLALDLFGRPVYGILDPTNTTNHTPVVWMGENLWNPTVSWAATYSLPYEIDLNNPSRSHLLADTSQSSGYSPFEADDKPFTPGELERLLRSSDADAASLPSRLTDLTYLSRYRYPVLLDHANEVTTESWDIPTASTMLPWNIYRDADSKFQDVRPGLPARHVTDLLRAWFPKPSTSTPITTTELFDLLPQEIQMGLKFDINRPFGIPRFRYNTYNTVQNPIDNRTEPILKNPAASTDWIVSLMCPVDNPHQDWSGNIANLTFFPSFIDAPNSIVSATSSSPPLYYSYLNPDNRRLSPYSSLVPYGGGPIYYDPSNGRRTTATPPATQGKPLPANGLQARQLYARYLYVLACLTCDVRGLVDQMQGLPADKKKRAARFLAQWAVNVVDFRDRDSIMTPFHYDYSFFDYVYETTVNGTVTKWEGWLYNSDTKKLDSPFTDETTDPKAWESVVWGCERPELLLTEAIALHDRRTADTNKENASTIPVSESGLPTRVPSYTTAAAPNTDPDYDQKYRPEGSLFFELFNPWTAQDAPAPELQSLDTTSADSSTAAKPNDFGVDLSLTTPTAGLQIADATATNVATVGDPVWRVLIANPNHDGYKANQNANARIGPVAKSQNVAANGYLFPDPDDSDPTNRRNFYDSVERSVYFAYVSPDRIYDEGTGLFDATKATRFNKLIRYYPSCTSPAAGSKQFSFAKIKPGRYAVVGPRPPNFTTPYSAADPSSSSSNAATMLFTFLGLQKNDTPGSDPSYGTTSGRRIELRPSPNAEFVTDKGLGQVAIYLDNNNPPTNILDLSKVAKPVAAVIDYVQTVDTPCRDSTVFEDAGLDASQYAFAKNKAVEFNYGGGKDVPRLSLTEPRDGYDVSGGVSGYFFRTLSKIYDTPYDLDQSVSHQQNDPKVGEIVMHNTTTYSYRVLFLQRLADPTRPWNPPPGDLSGAYNRKFPVNPYLTIDALPVDLNSFNGADKKPTAELASKTEDDQSITTATNDASANSATAITSRERGEYSGEFKAKIESALTDIRFDVNNLWSQNRLNSYTPIETAYAANSTTKTFVTSDFIPAPGWPTKPYPSLPKRPFRLSLGMLNDRFWYTNGNQSLAADTRIALSSVPAYRGAPSRPFPWLTWNNRPFISPLELLLVPSTSSSRLLLYYQMSTTKSNPYDRTTAGNFYLDTPFPHLLPMFQSAPCTEATDLAKTWAAQLYRLLDFVDVPSRFAGTATQIAPVRATNSTSNATTSTSDPSKDTTSFEESDATVAAANREYKHHFHPPFNWISNYREPGKINLNTMFSQAVWNGLMNKFPDQTDNADSPTWDTESASGVGMAMWRKFLWSRRSPTQAVGNGLSNASEESFLLDIRKDSTNQPLPTRFENPFRSFAGAFLVPPIPDVTTDALKNNIGKEINATLLRCDPDKTDKPLFSVREANYPNSVNPDLDNKDLRHGHPMNSSRNPYFQYQGIQRLKNLTTTKSNVYAVWITIGYFEVFPYSESVMSESNSAPFFPDGGGHYVPYDVWKKFHPDDLELGQELGIDTGEVKRHRAFYLIDRSLPAAFMRGQDVNYEKTILLERVIE